MRNFTILLLTTMTLLLSCNNDDDRNNQDLLEEIGLLGRWEIQSRLVNNISDLSALCCEFLEFQTGEAVSDTKGNLIYSGNGQDNNGTFEINNNGDVLLVDFGTGIDQYEINIQDNFLIIEYLQNNDNYSENWIRIID